MKWCRFGWRTTTRMVIVVCVLLAFCGAAWAKTPFEEFQAEKSPEIAKQACDLARWSVDCRLKGIEPKKPPMKLHRIFSLRAGVFVTMNKKGEPRGCWGTIEPQQKDIAREIIENAVGAATSDLRQKPLAPRELKQVTFCVSIMGPLKPVESKYQLAPDRLGLLVRGSSGEGILLPGEAKTARWQIAECKRKAGLPPDASVQMYVFETVALEEQAKKRSAGG